MKIGVLTTSYPRTESDLAGAFVRDLVTALVGRGHDVAVLAPEDREGGVPLPEVSTVAYLRPRALETTFYGAGVPANVASDPRAGLGLAAFPPALALAAHRRFADRDALLSHWSLPSGLVGGLVRRGRPHLAVVHSTDATWLGRMPFGRPLARAVEAGATTLWFSAPDVRARFESALGRAVHTPAIVRAMGPEPLPPVDRDAARAHLGLEGVVVTSLSRLVPLKGHADVPAALAGRADATWLVCGEGPERAALERAAAAASVRARFLGVVRGLDKARVLAATDVFVHPTRGDMGQAEGAPVALVEALTAGLPIVATDSGGTRDVLGDAGLLIPCDDHGALRGALARLLGDPAMRARLGARARVRAGSVGLEEAAERVERALGGHG